MCIPVRGRVPKSGREGLARAGMDPARPPRADPRRSAARRVCMDMEARRGYLPLHLNAYEYRDYG